MRKLFLFFITIILIAGSNMFAMRDVTGDGHKELLYCVSNEKYSVEYIFDWTNCAVISPYHIEDDNVVLELNADAVIQSINFAAQRDGYGDDYVHTDNVSSDNLPLSFFSADAGAYLSSTIDEENILKINYNENSGEAKLEVEFSYHYSVDEGKYVFSDMAVTTEAKRIKRAKTATPKPEKSMNMSYKNEDTFQDYVYNENSQTWDFVFSEEGIRLVWEMNSTGQLYMEYGDKRVSVPWGATLHWRSGSDLMDVNGDGNKDFVLHVYDSADNTAVIFIYDIANEKDLSPVYSEYTQQRYLYYLSDERNSEDNQPVNGNIEMKLYVGEDGQYDGRILIESFNTKSDKGEGAWSEYYIIPR